MFSNFKSFFINTTGNMAVGFALLILPLTLAVGVALDTANANYVKTNLQAAADAAALAGAAHPKLKGNKKSDEVTKLIEKVVADWADANGAKDIIAKIEKVTPNYDEAAGTFNVTIDSKMSTTVMRIIGKKEIDVGVQSTVNVGSRGMEVALVLDTTGSMGGNMTDGVTTRMAVLKKEAKNFVSTIIETKASYSDLAVAVVPFSEYVNYSGGCRGSQRNGAFSFVTANNCPVEALPLQDVDIQANITAVTAKIDSLIPIGATYIPDGLMWGWQALTKMPGAKSKAEQVSGRSIKAIVLMTDGANTMIEEPDGSHTNVAKGVVPTEANDALASTCKAAKADGIEIFAITFMVTDPVIQKLMNECASKLSDSFDADNATALNSAFSAIGKRLATLRIQM